MLSILNNKDKVLHQKAAFNSSDLLSRYTKGSRVCRRNTDFMYKSYYLFYKNCLTQNN